MALMQVLKTYYNDSQMTDTNSLVNALMEKPEELSPIITHLAGREEKNSLSLSSLKVLVIPDLLTASNTVPRKLMR